MDPRHTVVDMAEPNPEGNLADLERAQLPPSPLPSAKPESLPEQSASPTSSRRWLVYSFVLSLAVGLPLMAITTGHKTDSDGFGWQSILDAIRSRASVDLMEDFREDFSRWAGNDDALKSWSLDPAGYAHPGQLGLYIKSMPLSDYQMTFRGSIEKRSLGFVYRAIDFDNYYAGRLIVVRPGPIPEVALERYAVINGVAGPKTQVRLPFAAREDTLYDVQVEAQGDHFLTRINDQVIDSFSDSRIRSGGVGFFAGNGESSRICWVRLTSNTDTVGKLFSLLPASFGS